MGSLVPSIAGPTAERSAAHNPRVDRQQSLTEAPLTAGPPVKTDFLSDIVDEHADTAGFLRLQRPRLVRSRTEGLAALVRFDERLEAHLDALVLAAVDERTVSVVRANTGGAFVPAVLALRCRRLDILTDEILRADGDARRARDLVAALGWVPIADALLLVEEGALKWTPETGARLVVEARASRLGVPSRRAPALRIALLHVLRTHGGGLTGSGDPVAEGLHSDDPAVRAVALRAAGELGRRDLARDVTLARADADDGCRAWAAWTSTLFGDATGARALGEIARDGEDRSLPAATALDLAVRTVDSDDAEALVREVFARGREREALDAAAAWGEARVVPWLLGLFDEPMLARLAGWAFATITGVDLARAKLVGSPPQASDRARRTARSNTTCAWIRTRVCLGPTSNGRSLSGRRSPTAILARRASSWGGLARVLCSRTRCARARSASARSPPSICTFWRAASGRSRTYTRPPFASSGAPSLP
jgi:hypothetical protein